MRKDLVLMGTIAAIAGIGLAAVLTASLGVRSSGPPAPLRSAAPAKAAEPPLIAASEAPKTAPRKHVRKRVKRRIRHVRPTAPAPQPAIAQTAPVTRPAPAPVRPQRTQPVSAPAPAPAPVSKPAPAPVKQPSSPKRTGSPGVSFDDSG
jgi:hypothetical protein